MKSDIRLCKRVVRETMAHDEDDVLGNSYRLKGLFRHVTVSPTMRRLNKDFSQHLNDVRGLKVLEIGCGHGEQSLALLECGASVAGIDISQSYIEDATKKVEQEGYPKQRYEFRVMDAHSLDFPDDTFDLVIGRGILHHLDLAAGLNEMRRVLKLGSRALFIEPLAANPLLRLFRLLTPKARTVDERPLTSKDLERIQNSGWIAENTYYGVVSAPVAVITSIVLRPFDNNFLLRAADRIEQQINKIAKVHPLNQYVLLNLIRT